eukprot:TRINITY_DN1052_c1_g1_i1.p1 TRINITY_DN1052_c1_g1~~TRINITY_DN1052_c1_g1_i1.p1  ORF type:complete len:662 (-),score=222.39 TRINITY_DN1052_c1_g1_i1:94-2079(-)
MEPPPSNNGNQKNEKENKLESKIAEDEWDTEAWTNLVMEAQGKDISIARPIYRRFLQKFPTAGRYWKYFAEHEIQSGNMENAGKIFEESLSKCLNIDLWKCYVNFVQHHRSRPEAIQAFEYALSHVGSDVSSGPIWSDYINFVKELKVVSQHDEGNKTSQLRKIYQRAITTPIQNVETIWKDYDTWESELNKTLAKALINEYSPRYMAVRTFYKDRKKYYDGIIRNMLAKPPSASSPKEEEQVSFWKRLIEHEKSNPEKLNPEDLRDRIVYTYKQCLLCLYHYPEIWIDYANVESNNAERAIEVYKESLVAIPDCLVLYFAYANYLEEKRNVKDAKQVYEQLLERNPGPLAFVHFMKFCRRQENNDDYRKAFQLARRSPHLTWHVYVCSALIEFHVNKDAETARKVLEVALAKYSDNPNFIMEYIKFLYHLNEENNLRVLFENALGRIPKENAEEIWNQFISFEYQFGTLASVKRIESRMAALYPDRHLDGVLSLVHRTKFLDLIPCSQAELNSFGRAAAPAKEDLIINQDENPFAHKPKSEKFPRPDLTQMVPFKPDMTALPFDPNLPGGIYIPATVPVEVSQIIISLPSPNTYQGSIVNVDELFKILSETPLPHPSDGKDGKRRREEEEEEDAVSSNSAPAPSGLLRQRLAKQSKSRTN